MMSYGGEEGRSRVRIDAGSFLARGGPPFAALMLVNSSAGPSEKTFLQGWVILVILLIAAVVASLVIQKSRARKRTQAIMKAAIEMGFEFEGEDWKDKQRAPQLGTALFERGHDHELMNVMSGSASGMRASLFDYGFKTRTGRSQHHWKQSVGSFSKDGVFLPYFELRPVGMVDKIWGAVTHKNIDVAADREFSRRYVLRGALEDKVRPLFAPGLITYFESLDAGKKWHVEGSGDTLIVYRLEKRVPAEEIRTFLEETSAIAATFFNLAGASIRTA
jgi:hypothetical protein